VKKFFLEKNFVKTFSFCRHGEIIFGQIFFTPQTVFVAYGHEQKWYHITTRKQWHCLQHHDSTWSKAGKRQSKISLLPFHNFAITTKVI